MISLSPPTICNSALFGLTMALFHLWRRKVNKLPDWKDL
ncbi:DUF6404 family protein [Klebsiella pneumoniae]